MPFFRILLTRDLTESASVIVEADDMEQAQDIATTRQFESEIDPKKWELDDGSVSDTYIVDEDDTDLHHEVDVLGNRLETDD